MDGSLSSEILFVENVDSRVEQRVGVVSVGDQILNISYRYLCFDGLR